MTEGHSTHHSDNMDVEDAPDGTPVAANLSPVQGINRKRPRTITRLVSQEALSSMDRVSPPYISGDDHSLEGKDLPDDKHGRCSPMRCVSDFDKAVQSKHNQVPPLPNPLHRSKLLAVQTRALRLEAELHPMRPILARLMAHPTHNRKGLFNVPVDPVVLGLPDYFSIITTPMDLGTVKVRLHAVAYQSRDQVAEHIRLVFNNAMKYNPPHNAVHVSARELLKCFEEAYESLAPVKMDLDPNTDVSFPQPHPRTILRMVSVAENDTEGHESETVAEQSDVKNKGHCESQAVDRAIDTAVLAPVPQAVASDGTTGSTPNVQAHQATRKNSTVKFAASLPPTKRRRRSKLSQTQHSCHWCMGRTCAFCLQGCLPNEPTLLICNGSNCAGSKIRKNAVYYVAKDGSRQYCQRCYVSLQAVLPRGHDSEPVRYKRDLLKRKNEEEIAEEWLYCVKCDRWVHQICAMHNVRVHPSNDYHCPECLAAEEAGCVSCESSSAGDFQEFYTFVSGSEQAVPLSDVTGGGFYLGGDLLSSESLAETPESSFIQEKVRERMVSDAFPNAERTVVVRAISDCQKSFKVPDVIRKHFCMESNADREVTPPTNVKYRSKAIALFQKVDGLDVCVFCMYVHEYDGKDEYDNDEDEEWASKSKRVYIAYLDSVEHFRPRVCRTSVYHEMLVAYLASARARGYESAHIWACPPSRGNSYVFWNHPASQRTPSKERLLSWYHDALSRSIDCGIVTDVKSLYETAFKERLDSVEKAEKKEVSFGKMVCPPLLEGDFWIEEAVRIHHMGLARNLRTRSTLDGAEVKQSASLVGSEDAIDNCPARQVASLILDRIMARPAAMAFRKPVNPVAMKLKDYEKIVKKPMDLGTVYSRCVLGEYMTLREVVTDVRLVFSNARLFNPPGHYVHTQAVEVENLFFEELTKLTRSWEVPGSGASCGHSWCRFSEMSMSLDKFLVGTAAGAKCGDGPPNHGCNHLQIDPPKNLSGPTTSPVAPISPAGGMKTASTPIGPCQAPASRVVSPSSRKKQSKTVTAPERLDLISGGPEAVEQRMVGEDVWLMDKRNPAPPKGSGLAKKPGAKRRRSSLDTSRDQPASSQHRRRQCWLGLEVGKSVRRSRTSCFSCSLVPSEIMSPQEQDKAQEYESYIKSYTGEQSRESHALPSRIADARHALLEFSQFRNFEFSTLRRAKYSTTMFLYHLHHDDAPGTVPSCTSCGQNISEVRWHKITKGVERRPTGKAPFAKKGCAQKSPSGVHPEELCSECHAALPNGDGYVPIPVSFHS